MHTVSNKFQILKNKHAVFAAIIFALFLPLSKSKAQSTPNQDFIVLYGGDTLHGTVKYINDRGVSTKFYKKVRLTNSSGKLRKFKKKEVLSFKVDGTVYESFWLSQSSDKIEWVNPRYDIKLHNGKHYFLKLISKGALSHYRLEWIEQGESLIMSMDLLKKQNEQFFIRATQGLFGLKKKVLINYFRNCPAIKEQIEQKQLEDIGQIIEFYNSHCTFN